jgi:hypothetical protein
MASIRAEPAKTPSKKFPPGREIPTIGIVGTAKNTGKTTTIIHLLHRGYLKKKSFGLVGIGYDGEDVDTVTSLPKPRIWAPQGTWVATSKDCLAESTARFRIIAGTGIHTALGQVFIAKVINPGHVVVAGPNQSTGIRSVIERFKEHALDLILIDGSFNRFIPLMEADGVVLSTGAARSIHPAVIAQEMKAIYQVFSLEQAPAVLGSAPDSDQISLVTKDSAVRRITLNSVQDSYDAGFLASFLVDDIRHIIIPGVVNFCPLAEMLLKSAPRFKGKSFVFWDPGHVLVGGKVEDFLTFQRLLGDLGSDLRVFRRVSLIAVAVSSFYPGREPRTRNYVSLHIEKVGLREAVRAVVPIPVFDLSEAESEAELFDLVARDFPGLQSDSK